MNCIVTAGPTYEKLDQVRRLTNFSTGKLGIELARFLTERGHDVTLLVGEQATFQGNRKANRVEVFSTTADLQGWFQALAGGRVDAVFHAAAVSDFCFGKVFVRTAGGELEEIRSGKLTTRQGPVLAELVPTPKLIAELRDWYPRAKLVGWKYEVDGDRESVIAAGARQLHECLTDVCVANGPAFGVGFGLVTPNGRCLEIPDHSRLFEALEGLAIA